MVPAQYTTVVNVYRYLLVGTGTGN
eukprot:COSAG05_NODE_25832_length_193_cov_32.297872_1_plen_24_part_10